MPDIHAVLSASSAERWLNCPPSARICAKTPDTGSTYAAEGTLAHSMCEVKLSAFVAATPKRTVTAKLNKLKKNELYAPEMDGYTDTYVDYVKKIALSFPSKAYVCIEKQVNFSSYVPEGFGTSDCIILYGEELYIIDFKYGKGIPVSAENNPQLKLYALGAYTTYSMFYSIKQVHLCIVQPQKWLEDETGEELISLNKALVQELRDKKGTPEVVDRVLAIRQELGKSSVTKYQTMTKCICPDGRVRGLLQFYGANRTGRWAGR
ncbi:MAG: DUF2800 domain-containing protein [Clostridia bacterium]|nr:DUF2800 domain-containing protein [Clostridia bacterium]